MKTAKFLKAPARRLIMKMLEMVQSEPGSVDQNSYPEGIDTGICNSPYCATGHLIFAKSPRLFTKLCKREAQYNNVNWDAEARDVLGLGSHPMYHPAPGVSPYYNSWFGFSASWPDKFSSMYTTAASRKTKKAREKGKMRAFVARWQDLLDNDGRDPVS